MSPPGLLKIQLEEDYHEFRSNLHGVKELEFAWRGLGIKP